MIPQHKNPLSILKSPRAVSMVEVLISVFIIAIASVAASTIIITAFTANRVSKDKLIAINLAREGIEAVRNIRDSNWFRYSANTDACWNFWENPEASIPVYTCYPDYPNQITEQQYYLQIGREDVFSGATSPYTYKYWLSDATMQQQVDLDNATASEIANGNFSEYRLYKKTLNGVKMYVTSDDNNAATETQFYRQISISYPEDTFVMEVAATVLWLEKGQTKTVQHTTSLTNYIDTTT